MANCLRRLETETKTFFYHKHYCTFLEAQKQCESRHNGRLAVIENRKLLDLTITSAPARTDKECFENYYWIGLEQQTKNGSFQWINGKSYDGDLPIRQWFQEERGDRVALYPGYGRLPTPFLAVNSTRKLSYMCEAANTGNASKRKMVNTTYQSPSPSIFTVDWFGNANTIIPSERTNIGASTVHSAKIGSSTTMFGNITTSTASVGSRSAIENPLIITGTALACIFCLLLIFALFWLKSKKQKKNSNVFAEQKVTGRAE